MTNRIRFAFAHDVFEAFPVLRGFAPLPPPGVEPEAYVRQLLVGPRPKHALTVLGYLLARREAVWWGRRCLASMLGPAGEDEYVRAVEDWVRSPEEETRRAALALGQAGDSTSPTAWLARAVGASGGSLTAADQAPVPAQPQACAQAVVAAVTIAASGLPAPEIRAWIEACVEAGLAFAAGGDMKITPPRAPVERR